MKINFIFFIILNFLSITFSEVYANCSEVNNIKILNYGNAFAGLSLQINQKKDSIQIIYNPERDHVKITLEITGFSENNEWFFIQPTGEVYKQGKINSLSTGMYQITINTKKLKAGEYTFEIKDSDILISKKIAIVK